MTNINKTFIYCGIVSLVAIAFSIVFPIPLPLAILFELGPLVVYFLLLLRGRHDGLASSAIDSVYYFGFLITIFSLAASVLRVWIGGIGNDIMTLVSHFGVGLLATGIALAFRLYLTAVTEQLDKKDLDEAIDAYIRRVDAVVTKVELSASNFEGLANSLEQRTKSVAAEALDHFQITMRDSAKVFQTEIAAITATASTSIESFSSTVQRVASSEHIASFNKDIAGLSSGLAVFSDEMRSYARKVGEDTQIALRQAFSESIRAHTHSLTTMTSEAMVSIEKLVSTAANVDFSEDATAVREQMQSLSSTVNNVTRKFVTIDEKLERTVVENSAAAVRTLLQEFTSQVAEVSTWVGEKTSEQVAAIFRDVAGHASEAIGATSNAAAVHVTADLQALSQEIGRLSQSLGNTSLVRQLENLGEATGRVSVSVHGSAERMTNAMEETTALVSRVRDAKETFDLSSIQRALDQIAEGFEALDNKLAQSLSKNSLPARLDQFAAAADQMTATVGRTSDALNPVVSNLALFQDKIATLPTVVDTNKLKARFEALCDALVDQELRLKTHGALDAKATNQPPFSPSAMHMSGPKAHDVEKENEDPQAVLR